LETITATTSLPEHDRDGKVALGVMPIMVLLPKACIDNPSTNKHPNNRTTTTTNLNSNHLVQQLQGRMRQTMRL
jgi:hypothetical protein